MNKFKTFKEDSLYELEDKVNKFLKENYGIKVISQKFRVEEVSQYIEVIEFNFKATNYICTITYEI